MNTFQPIAVNRSGVTIPYGIGQFIVATVPFSDGTTTYEAGVYVDAPTGRQQLTMQGPQGEPGKQGEEGQQGIQGIQGIQGVPGRDGANGRSYEINGQVDTPEELPAPSATYLGEAYFVGTTEPRLVYACVEYEGAIQWQNQGTLQGPEGPQGEQGIEGKQGPDGPQGPQGIPGEKGEPGESFTIRQWLDLEYPAGGNRPYIQYPNEPTPAEKYAGTSWEIDTAMQGRTIIGSGGSYTFGSSGGEATHSLTTAQMAPHSHYPDDGYSNIDNRTSGSGWRLIAGQDNRVVWEGEITTSTQGSGEAFNIMQPYTVVNFWKRTA